jgi:hypothetical protein
MALIFNRADPAAVPLFPTGIVSAMLRVRQWPLQLLDQRYFVIREIKVQLRTTAMRTGVALLLGTVMLNGCGPTTRTRMDHWPNGAVRAKESFYIGRSGRMVLHGPTTYWDENGKLQQVGTWRDGKPWDGVCWVPLPGDAGSIGGLGTFKRYKKGTFVENVEGRP